MNQRKNELNVDYIGGATPLTKKEEELISAFIKAAKEKARKQKSGASRKKKAVQTNQSD